MQEQIVRFMCPDLSCRAILSAPAEARGKRVRCTVCGAPVRVPLPKRPDEKADAPAEKTPNKS